jgi:hypothetical protein
VLSASQTQIAVAASLIVKQFMQDAVRSYLQTAMDEVEEKLGEAGVELPTGLRATGGK